MKWNKSKGKLRGWQSYRLFLAEKKEFFCSDSDWFGFTHMCFSRFIWFDVTVYVFIVHHALQYSLDRKVRWQLNGHCTTVLYWGVEFYFSYFLFPISTPILFLAHPFSHVTVAVGYTFVALVVVTVLVTVMDCLRTRLFVFLFLHVMGLVFIGYPLWLESYTHKNKFDTCCDLIFRFIILLISYFFFVSTLAYFVYNSHKIKNKKIDKNEIKFRLIGLTIRTITVRAVLYLQKMLT